MPMKNTAAYVQRAVLSVLSGAPADTQMIVTDDGSTDGSRSIVESIGDSRISVISGPGKGPAAAWNAAMRLATGDVIMQCDSDDLYPTDRIAWQMTFLEQHPEFGAVCGGFETIEPNGRVIVKTWAPAPLGQEITQELLQGKTRTHLCTFAIRRKCLERLGGKREYFETAEDIDLQLRLAECCRVWFEPRNCYQYRLHDSSITHSQPSARGQFFEGYARELRMQRAEGGADDLERGQPKSPPGHKTSPVRSGSEISGMLVGAAWRAHKSGEKLNAVVYGCRALRHHPYDLKVWKNLLLLVLRPSGLRS
jgi:glycosyltransferase involved in cell wall biosynthesis